MTPVRISFGLGEHEDTARALLQREWPLADLPSAVNEPRIWTMTCAGSNALAGLAVVVNGFRARAVSADGMRPYRPLLEYLVVDQEVRGEGLGRQLARRVLEEASKGGHDVRVEVERMRPGAVRFWMQHMHCTFLPEAEQTDPKIYHLRWSPAGS
ncbi:GNAT family N-acetyltransferase [Streptomyces werraensis]|uniref:GNAT family N-acetyltransferase n=1 Tax=Streptomyces werraensis TaxID=68284 RepID=UPI003329E1F7